MSTMLKKFPAVFAVFAHILIFTCAGFAQIAEVKIKIAAPNQPFVHIETKFPTGEIKRKLTFPQNYADAENLDARIENLKIKNDKNQEVGFIKTSAGEIQTAAGFSAVSYNLKIFVPENVLTTAHVSWLSETHGLLMLNDLLPDLGEKASAKVLFELPDGWKISASEKQTGEKSFQVSNVQTAVFLIGADWRQNSISVGDSIINFSVVGDWSFTPAQAAQTAGEILTEYQKIFGAIPEQRINIFLLRFPREIGFERWRAETRGANITILSAPTAFETLAAQRLHEQLRHELFHLWIPNNLSLTGDYAWFYEGFTQYAALRTGVKLNRISFYNFLNTLEQAINLTRRQNQTLSLLEASKSRWRGNYSGVYAEGIIIAFLADAALLRESGGKIDLFDVFRQVFQKYHPAENKIDGNTAILEILQNYKGLVPIVEKYIKGANKINFVNDLNATGIEISETDARQKLQIKAQLNRREKDLLNKLGYNNWRKVVRNP